MKRAPIPNDILQEIIGALAQSSTDETQTYPTEVKKFATLSSFCLQEVRKHVFAKVQLKTGYTYRERCRKQSTLEEQLDFFSQHIGPLPYIRRLSLTVSNAEMLDQELQARLFDMLIQLPHLVALEIHSVIVGPIYIRNRNQWTQITFPKSVRSALQMLLRNSRVFMELHLLRIVGFPFKDLEFVTNLRHLELNGTPLVMDDDNDAHSPDIRCHLHSLEYLVISDCAGEEHRALKTTASLLTKRPDGELIIRFSRLKSLEVDINGVSTFTEVSKLLHTRGCNHLESLTLNLYMEGADGNGDYSASLDDIILPLHTTLKSLTTRIWIATVAQDPFAGLCSTLEHMQENNILSLLNIDITVYTDSPCTRGSKWAALSRALARAGQWKSLREVNLKVMVTDYGRPGSSLQIALERLRETHHQSLFSNSFKFNYEVERCTI